MPAVDKQKAANLANKALIIVGAATVGSWLFNKAFNAAYNNVGFEYVSSNFDWSMITQGKVIVNVQIKVINNNAVGLTVNRLEGKVSYGNLDLGTVNTPMPISIPARGQATANVSFTVNSMTLANDIVNAFSNNGNLYSLLINRLNFKGTVYTNLVNVPLDMPIPIA